MCDVSPNKEGNARQTKLLGGLSYKKSKGKVTPLHKGQQVAVTTDSLLKQHFSAMKFYMGYEKNVCSIPKFPKVGKKVEKIGLGSFK